MIFNKHLAAFAAASVVALAPAAVEAMTVQPVVVDMSTAGRGMSASVRVENNSSAPLPVELRINETDFTATTVTASDRPSEDIMAFPPQAIIPPGQTQVFRLQYLGDPDTERSKHYYVTVAQLPVELPEGQSAIQILYNFQVMVNVASATATPPQMTVTGTGIATNADGKPVATFTVNNAGLNYGYLANNRVTIIERDAAGKEVFRRVLSSNDVQQTIGFGLLGPEQTRTFKSPVELPSADGRIEVTLAAER